MTASSASSGLGWRTPTLILLAGALVAALTNGPRSSIGFFTTDISTFNAWPIAVFSFAIAVQNLIWGIGQPIAGLIADRYGAAKVLIGGSVLYAAGLAWMAFATTPATMTLSAGVLFGFALAGCSFNLVLAAFSKLLAPEKRSLALGVGTAAGSFGQFFFNPLTVQLQNAIGWQPTLLVYAATMLAVIPLAIVLATPPAGAAAPGNPAADNQTAREAFREAFGHRSYVLLFMGFFVCGFQIAFVTVHLPRFLADNGISAFVGGWVMALIGLFNIIGSLGAGLLSNRFPRPYILSIIYAARAVAVVVFLLLPITPTSALIFGAVLGILWLSTVPPTSGLVAVMFGTRWMAMLYGFVFFSHQVGSFIGVWLAGIAYDAYGNYNIVWWIGIALGVFAALVHLPIREAPVARLAPRPA